LSYDLYLLRVPAGEDPLEAAEAIFNQDVEEINPGMPEPQKEAAKRELAEQLQLISPSLEAFQFDYSEIAKSLKISEQEARTEYRHLELNAPDDGNGIQITLYDDTASLTIPYWHEGEKASEVWREAWRCLECLERHGGLSTYDPQLDRMLSLASDLDEVRKEYAVGVGATDAAMRELGKESKPWWKIW
jgi:hypothetical protein